MEIPPGSSLGQALKPGMKLGKTFFKSRVAAGAAVVADGLVEGAGGRKDPHVAFGAGDGGVDEVALQHHVMAGV